MPQVDTACLILVGGRSRRMGQNKALLPLPGDEQTTFIEAIIRLVRPYASEVVIVARNAEDRVRYRFPDLRVILDETPDQGPLMGIYSGLRAIESERALVLAVDTPCLQPALLAYLFGLPASEAVYVPVVATIPQVLLALYPRSLLCAIEARLQQGRSDPRGLLAEVSVNYLAETELRQFDPELRSFLSANTPAELQEIMNLL